MTEMNRSIIRQDTKIVGNVRNAETLEVFGEIEGDVVATNVVVHASGKLTGTTKVSSLDVSGQVDGSIETRNLLTVRSSGRVSGDLTYGRMAMEDGGILNASVKNVPPRLEGDLRMSVSRGAAVRVSLDDISAVDPDNSASELVFSVSNVANGAVMTTDAPQRPVSKFTQADLQRGAILFKHDGSQTTVASFDVVVADAQGATSGKPQSVRVDIR